MHDINHVIMMNSQSRSPSRTRPGQLRTEKNTAGPFLVSGVENPGPGIESGGDVDKTASQHAPGLAVPVRENDYRDIHSCTERHFVSGILRAFSTPFVIQKSAMK